MKAFEAVADALARERVEVVFNYADELTVALADAAFRRGIKVISTRHEQAAVVMADGYSRVTGKPGVCIVGSGPAIAQTGTGLLTARKHRSPLLVIAGDLPARTTRSVKCFEQRAYVLATAGTVVTLNSVATLAQDVRHAFHKVRSGAGPVVFNAPVDILDGDCTGPWEYLHVGNSMSQQRVTPDADCLDRAAEMLIAAKRPIIVAGKGAVVSDARSEIEDLAGRIDALLATTIQARGFFTGHRSDVGIMGALGTEDAMKLFAQADYVLVVGASLNPYTVGADPYSYNAGPGRMTPKARVIQVDVNPGQINDFSPVDLSLTGDARAVLSALNKRLQDVGITGKLGFWSSEHMKPQVEAARVPPPPTDEKPGNPIHISKVVSAFERILPKRRTVVMDGGTMFLTVLDYISVPDPYSFVWTLDFGSIGLGLPMAAGAAIGKQEQPCILFTGDGGFMMSVGELDTAVRYQIPLTVVILNDGALAGEAINLRLRGLPTDLAVNKNPDFTALAVGFGAKGIPVRKLEDVEQLPKMISEAKGPLVVDARISQDDIPRRAGPRPWW